MRAVCVCVCVTDLHVDRSISILRQKMRGMTVKNARNGRGCAVWIWVCARVCCHMTVVQPVAARTSHTCAVHAGAQRHHLHVIIYVDLINIKRKHERVHRNALSHTSIGRHRNRFGTVLYMCVCV